ncbi:MAG: aryl-sulfate sulfotransferase [Lewinellaceae bacterium]|nr:aryl-sulfate sulfotransferase [Lewinellaceae bacterium]
MLKKPFALSAALFLLAVLSCRQEDDIPPPDDNGPKEVPVGNLLSAPITIEMDPNGLTPLAGIARISTLERTEVEMQIPGEYPVQVASKPGALSHEMLVLGLYPGRENEIIFKISNTDNSYYGYDTLTVEAPPLPDFLPEIEIIKKQPERLEPGWNLIEMSLGGGGYFRFYPLIFDPGGQVRWYMNLDFIRGWIGPFERLRNGNWLWSHEQALYEYDMLGKEVNRWSFPGYFQHHDQIEKPDGNFIVCVTKEGLDTRLDHFIEVDRNSGGIVREWDLRQVLDIDRFDLVWNSTDWVHVNSVWYDETDGGLLISGRHQGIIKVSQDNQLEWILAPHRGWEQAGPAGNGPNTAGYLLTAIDEGGAPYGEEVQQGAEDATGFSWPWGQHAAMLLPNGHVFCFDNSFQKNFGNNEPFIRGVEYEVDSVLRTVEQVWEYGRERGEEIHSSNISDVDYLPATGNRLICPGNINQPGIREGRMIEVTAPGGEVVFEAVVKYKNTFSTGDTWAKSDMIYRAERLPLYPE